MPFDWWRGIYSGEVRHSDKILWGRMGEQINKMRQVHTVEYYSALKREEILTQATICFNSEGHYTKWNKAGPKRQGWCRWTHLRHAELSDTQTGSAVSVTLGMRGKWAVVCYLLGPVCLERWKEFCEWWWLPLSENGLALTEPLPTTRLSRCIFLLRVVYHNLKKTWFRNEHQSCCQGQQQFLYILWRERTDNTCFPEISPLGLWCAFISQQNMKKKRVHM